MQNKTIPSLSIIGTGSMGRAILKGLEKSNLLQAKVNIADTNPNALQQATSKHTYMQTISEIAKIPTPTIICVKPHQVQEVVQQINDNRLIISIAAGVSLQTIESSRKVSNSPIVRVMPNTPFQIQQGMTAFVCNSFCSKEDVSLVQTVFQTGGKTLQVEDENLIDVITALSGSGPAYVFTFLKAMEDTGVLLGLPRNQARQIALQTVLGSTSLAVNNGLSVEANISAVTSPGGTTIHALRELSKKNFSSALQDAIVAAYQRSKELNQ